MKREGYLFEQLTDMATLRQADANAQKEKGHQPGVIRHNKNQEANLLALQQQLQEGTYRISGYTTFPIYEPKQRLIYRLEYYPHRIVQHALMIVLMRIFLSCFTADTYSCIRGRGVHSAATALKKALRNRGATRYCLKMDIKKFYPSVDGAILKQMLRRKIKDGRMLALMDHIIDSAEGLPIGNYLSQYLANFYLTYLDHWLKEQMDVRYYFRYADDIVILSDDKTQLHSLLGDIRQYLQDRLHLTLKHNYQVFPVAARGIDFVGYVFFHTHTRLRKTIKKNFARAVAKGKGKSCIESYKGWAKHCNSRHLKKKLLHEKV